MYDLPSHVFTDRFARTGPLADALDGPGRGAIAPVGNFDAFAALMASDGEPVAMITRRSTRGIDGKPIDGNRGADRPDAICVDVSRL